MNQMQELVMRAQSLNPFFTLSPEWSQQVQALDQAAQFLDQANRILAAEKDLRFYDPRHYRSTVDEKQTLSYRQCKLLSQLIGQVFPARLDLVGTAGILGSANQAEVDSLVRGIGSDGIVTLPRKLDRTTIHRIKNNLEAIEFECRLSKKLQSGVQADSNLEGAWWLHDLQKLAALSDIQSLALDPTILSIAQGVLGTMPIHVQSNAWWTFPVRQAPGESLVKMQQRNAQWFHQDMEFIDFVKVFVYLSDVGPENGPHVYVQGSANDYEEKLPGVIVSRRVSDEDIASAFGKDRVWAMTGEAGTILVANTRGYHKGAPVMAGHRLLLQFEYAASMYFNSVVPFQPENLAQEHRQLYGDYPRLFQNYRRPVEKQTSTWRKLMSRLTGSSKAKAA